MNSKNYPVLTEEQLNIAFGQIQDESLNAVMGTWFGSASGLGDKAIDRIREALKMPEWKGWSASQLGRVRMYKTVATSAASSGKSHWIERTSDFHFLVKGGSTVNGKVVSEPSLVVKTLKAFEVHPADPFYDPEIKYTSQIEENFIRDLIFATKPGEGRLDPTAVDTSFEGAGALISHAGVVSFLSSFAEPLGKGMFTSMNVLEFRTQLLSNWRSLAKEVREVLLVQFYHLIWNVRLNASGGAINVPGSGLKKIKVSNGDKAAVARLDPITESVTVPALSRQLTILAAERSFRGSDDSKASYFSSMTHRGMRAKKERQQMCDVISLLTPVVQLLGEKKEAEFVAVEADKSKDVKPEVSVKNSEVEDSTALTSSKKVVESVPQEVKSSKSEKKKVDAPPPIKKEASVPIGDKKKSERPDATQPVTKKESVVPLGITIIPPSDALIPKLINYVALQKWTFPIFYMAWDGRFEELSSTYPNLVVRVPDPSHFVIDFKGGSLPMVEKKQNLETQWTALLDPIFRYLKQFRGFISYRKVFAGYIQSRTDLKFYSFHSSHAFDCLVTNSDVDVRAIKIWDDVGKCLTLATEKLIPIDPGLWHETAMKDSRLRTFALPNAAYGVVDLGLNLYGSHRELSKKETRQTLRTFARLNGVDEELMASDLSLFANSDVVEKDDEEDVPLEAPAPVGTLDEEEEVPDAGELPANF